MEAAADAPLAHAEVGVRIVGDGFEGSFGDERRLVEGANQTLFWAQSLAGLSVAVAEAPYPDERSPALAVAVTLPGVPVGPAAPVDAPPIPPPPVCTPPRMRELSDSAVPVRSISPFRVCAEPRVLLSADEKLPP